MFAAVAFTAAFAVAVAGCATAPTAAAGVAASPAQAPVVDKPADADTDDAALHQDFAGWVTGFRASARAAGIAEATLRAAFDGVDYLPRVVELDRAQPEFTRTVWEYLDAGVSPQRVTLGQAKLMRFHAEADSAATRYGVPAETLVAIWGIESNYGGNHGSIPTIDALATLGFEGRREAWARSRS